MLQKIGDKLQGQRWLAFAMLGMLALVFAFWGAYGIVDLSTGSGSYAAKVNGEEISAAEVNRAWQEQQPQYLRVFGGELSPAQRDQLQNRLLDSYIRNAAVLQRATQQGFRVTDEQIRQAYANEPAFQVEGKFSAQAAFARLAAAGIAPAAFDAEQRRSLLMSQLAGAIGGTDFLTPTELSRLQALQDEQREQRFVLFTPQQFSGTAPIDAAAIQAWYDAHPTDFLTTESVKLAYATLALGDVGTGLQVSESQLRERYEKAKDSYVEPERRQARHILISAEKSSDDAKAKAQADALYAQVMAGQDFAELAKANSKDAGSAPQGGDLGWADRTVYVPAFADALFSMKEGEVSKPVKTQFGYHIIKLEGIQAGKSKTFDDVKAELEVAMRRDLAADRFGEQQEQLQQRIERGSGSFEALVKEFGLKAGEVASFTRGAGGEPLGADAALNATVFGDKVLNQRLIGGPASLGDDRLVIFRVLEHKPAVPKPLAEVRDGISAQLLRQRGAEAANKAAEAALARLAGGESLDKVAAEFKLKAEPARFVGRADPGLPVQVRSAVFAGVRPEAGKPVRKVVKLDEGGAAVLEVTAVRTGPEGDNAQLRAQRLQSELQRHGRVETEAYIGEIVRTAKIKKNLKAFQ
jgi:peptidyl-prolyl cis-trans isomerase D